MKNSPKAAIKLSIVENNESASTETAAIQARIQQRAFEISQTRPPNAHEIYDWMMAESEVISLPPAELIEKDGKFELRFALAGVNADDVTVMVAPNQILLKSQYSHEHASDVG